MSETDLDDRLEVIIGNPEKPTLHLVLKAKDFTQLIERISKINKPTAPTVTYAGTLSFTKEDINIRKIRSEYQEYKDEIRVAFDNETRELDLEEEEEIEKLKKEHGGVNNG